MVELIGSEKQVAWANDIRKKALEIGDIRRNFSYIENESSAKFWIENRYNLTGVIISRAQASRKTKGKEAARSMSKSEIFKRAHALARKIKNASPEVDYSAEFSICLKALYAAIKEIKAA